MERIYTIPLRDVKRVPRTKRSPRAMRYIREFIQKHMKPRHLGHEYHETGPRCNTVQHYEFPYRTAGHSLKNK